MWTNIQEASGSSTTPNAARTISCKAWNCPVECPSCVARCDIKGTDDTMWNSIFLKKVQGQKYYERGDIAEYKYVVSKCLNKY